MTITLDDIYCLLHIPIQGNYATPPTLPVTSDHAIGLAESYLGAGRAEAVANTKGGPYYNFTWLHQIFERNMEEGGDLTVAVRAYLLLLLTYSIFTTKTGDRAEAKWLLYLADMTPETLGGYAWGAGALAAMYDNLKDASLRHTAQLGGYASLFQSWIMWYIPRLAERKPGHVRGAEPLAGRFRKKKTDHLKLRHYRRMLDDLRPEDVCWRPFEEHRAARPFEQISLYRGFISWADFRVPYMPDRCLRQFGYAQYIPRDPLRGRPSHTECVFRLTNFMASVEDIMRRAHLARRPDQTVRRYLDWYVRASLPRLLPAPPSPVAEPWTPSPELRYDDHQWVQTIVQAVREGIRDGEIPMGSRVYRTVYPLVGMAPPSEADVARARRGRGRGRGR